MTNIYPIITIVSKEPEKIGGELPEEVFNYPFFNEGVSQARTHQKKKYNLDSIKIEETDKQLELKGLIFHVSHCGSTLLSRMMGQLEKVKVVSETEAINGLLLSKLFYGLKDEVIINYLKKIVHLYQQEVPNQQYLILKLTSWNIYMIPLFKQAFPGVKWIFLDRETDALLASLKRSDGGFIDWWEYPVDVLRKHFIEGGRVINNKDEYLKELVRGHRRHAKTNIDDNGLFLQYPAFIAQYEEILHHFELNFPFHEVAQSKEILKYDSKSKERVLWEKTK